MTKWCIFPPVSLLEFVGQVSLEQFGSLAPARHFLILVWLAVGNQVKRPCSICLEDRTIGWSEPSCYTAACPRSSSNLAAGPSPELGVPDVHPVFRSPAGACATPFSASLPTKMKVGNTSQKLHAYFLSLLLTSKVPLPYANHDSVPCTVMVF